MARSKEKEFQDQSAFKAIINSAQEGVLVVDAKGTILMANPSSARIFGYSSGDLIGKKVDHLLPSHLRKIHHNHRKGYHDNPRTRLMGQGIDLVGLKKDGSEFPVEVSLSHTEINNQSVAIAFIIDISVRKAIEEAIKREKETAQMYLDVAGAIFLVINKDQSVALINQKGSELLGYPEHEIIGKNWFDHFIPKRWQKGIKEVFENNMKGKEKPIRYYENPVVCRNGEERLIYWQNTIIKDDKNSITASLSSGVDVTDRKAAEDALRKSEEKLIIYASELEKKVKERTDELAKSVKALKKLNKDLKREIEERMKAEQDVRDALSQQRELNALKSRFVSMASHEFRTPLSAILSSASLISKYKDADTEEKRSKHVTRIKASVSNMTNILNDFLSLGKLEEGKVSLNTSVFDLVVLGRESIEETQLGAKRGQKIVMISNKDRQEVLLDRNLTKNILNNLLSNAVKYSVEDKDSKLSFNFKDKWITIKVTDQGMGIPIEDQEHIFERFFRAQNATYIQGTGLGLNLVKKYVGMMKGSISFKSELNVGTVFTAKLPYKV
ncbi:MAG: PAS domain S-box protein [Bacteroidetes bacterium]|nr:PAS domain S-box protein [Bacteroidota bacterium]